MKTKTDNFVKRVTLDCTNLDCNFVADMEIGVVYGTLLTMWALTLLGKFDYYWVVPLIVTVIAAVIARLTHNVRKITVLLCLSMVWLVIGYFITLVVSSIVTGYGTHAV
jgi:hypothetical protein